MSSSTIRCTGRNTDLNNPDVRCESDMLQNMFQNRPSPPSILYLEDHEDTRDFVTFLLTRAGYDVCAVSTVQEAKNILKPQGTNQQGLSPTLLILDFMLSDGSGLELCRELQLSHPETFVFFLSGNVSAEDHTRALEAGAVDFLNKPVEPSVLLAAVAKFVK